MSIFREIIKETIHRSIDEMGEIPHFEERINLRLKSIHTDFPGDDPEIAKNVDDIINFLRYGIDFKERHDTQLHMCFSIPLKQKYNAYDPKEDNWSRGNTLWIITRNSRLWTVYFEPSNAIEKVKRKCPDLTISVDSLVDYITHKKNEGKAIYRGDKILLSYGDIQNLNNLTQYYKHANKPQEDPVVKIEIGKQNRSFGVDRKNGEVYLMNDKTKKFKIEDVIYHQVEGLKASEDTIQKLFNYL